ncbi:PREDICTED: uncharacterized protein LOC18602522 [Theobroma cacao]|uniref:Uncharacterized protein LOC18602522 n=1 Tax=Theobroma cacao TaxID=3641 RepID=A0AB32V950_THECC|nr:PREDICTED: uncharacterized protein LOC18602522 [Theobroma cacao]
MSESGNFGHQHSLVLNEGQSNQSERAFCSRCKKKLSLSAPSFSCAECEFHLHKKCAEAPLEINHPFHCKHPFLLLQHPPYGGRCFCDFCGETCKAFIYHCSCGLDFHITCALFTYNIAQKNFEELQHVALQDPLVSTENDGEELDSFQCFGCWKPLLSSTYFSLDCGFHLHKKCAELALKISHMCHRKHPLVLQFYSLWLSCNICQDTRRRGFVYCCLPCKVAVHIECVSPLPVIEDKSHQHPFTLFWIRAPFVCHACGIEGNCAAYVCCTCSIIVHKKCISLPRIIKQKRHHHLIFHKYFLHEDDFKSWDCIICHEDVNAEHGCYSCSDCKITAHVNCAMKDENWYYLVSPENKDEESTNSLALLPGESIDSITCVFERNDAGEATKIKHFKHMHDLMLSEKIAGYDKCCEGCMLPISASFYCCSECDIFLHKACAELPKMKMLHSSIHVCPRRSLSLTSNCIFRCGLCWHLSNGFAYKCDECGGTVCLRCGALELDSTLTCRGHEHPLRLHFEYEGKCCACGGDILLMAYRCKDCSFALHCKCVAIPTTTQHKCDEHVLVLTYGDDNDYLECHYCDICEKEREPNLWFYQCIICYTFAHIDCVLGRYPFIKLGSIYKEGDHPHPLTFVKKIYYYPKCIECSKSCQDLALECVFPGCNYIVHWKCIAPDNLQWSVHLL